jgi:hypothetical protein
MRSGAKFLKKRQVIIHVTYSYLHPNELREKWLLLSWPRLKTSLDLQVLRFQHHEGGKVLAVFAKNNIAPHTVIGQYTGIVQIDKENK